MFCGDLRLIKRTYVGYSVALGGLVLFKISGGK